MNHHFPHTVLAKRFAFLFSFPHALALQRVGAKQEVKLKLWKVPESKRKQLGGKVPMI